MIKYDSFIFCFGRDFVIKFSLQILEKDEDN